MRDVTAVREWLRGVRGQGTAVGGGRFVPVRGNGARSDASGQGTALPALPSPVLAPALLRGGTDTPRTALACPLQHWNIPLRCFMEREVWNWQE